MPLGLPMQYPTTTGPRPSFGHIELKILGMPFAGCKKVTYGRTRSREMMRGAHPDPLGKSLGENEYKASIELYWAEFQMFLQQLSSQASAQGAGYGDLFFDVTVTTNANGFSVVTDTIIGCTLDTTESDNSQGTSNLTRSFELNPVKILFGGLDDVSAPLGLVSVSVNLSL